jgi:hypothetical protein
VPFCREVHSLPGTDLSILDNYSNLEEFERYCGEDAYGHDIRHSGLVVYLLVTYASEDGSFEYTSMKRGTLTGYFYNRPTKVSKFNALSESFLEANNPSLPNDFSLEHCKKFEFIHARQIKRNERNFKFRILEIEYRIF